MNLAGFRFLADENVDQDVVAHMLALGWDVLRARDLCGPAESDLVVMRAAYADGRVVVTHDADFGQMAVAGKEPVIGIVYLRPGHIRSDVTIATLDTIVAANLNLAPPFILVGLRHEAGISIRVRRLPSG